MIYAGSLFPHPRLIDSPVKSGNSNDKESRKGKLR